MTKKYRVNIVYYWLINPVCIYMKYYNTIDDILADKNKLYWMASWLHFIEIYKGRKNKNWLYYFYNKSKHIY